MRELFYHMRVSFYKALNFPHFHAQHYEKMIFRAHHFNAKHERKFLSHNFPFQLLCVNRR